jgi:hypothetical protein
MDKIILDSEQYSISGADLKRITDNKANIISYEHLENVNHLSQILHPHGAVIILYETKENFGHWVCLLEDEKEPSHLEFFDPYGLTIDEELKFSDLHLRQHQGKITPHLTALVNAGGYKVESNKTQLQKFLHEVNSCGRWVGMRIRLRDRSLKDFVKLMTKNKEYDGDFWVSALTLFC